MVKPESHIHTVERVRSKSPTIRYRCIHPDCTFFANREYLEGKKNACPICQSTHMLSWADLRKKLPHCGCKTDKQIVDFTAIETMLLANKKQLEEKDQA